MNQITERISERITELVPDSKRLERLDVHPRESLRGVATMAMSLGSMLYGLKGVLDSRRNRKIAKRAAVIVPPLLIRHPVGMFLALTGAAAVGATIAVKRLRKRQETALEDAEERESADRPSFVIPSDEPREDVARMEGEGNAPGAWDGEPVHVKP